MAIFVAVVVAAEKRAAVFVVFRTSLEVTSSTQSCSKLARTSKAVLLLLCRTALMMMVKLKGMCSMRLGLVSYHYLNVSGRDIFDVIRRS